MKNIGDNIIGTEAGNFTLQDLVIDSQGERNGSNPDILRFIDDSFNFPENSKKRTKLAQALSSLPVNEDLTKTREQLEQLVRSRITSMYISNSSAASLLEEIYSSRLYNAGLRCNSEDLIRGIVEANKLERDEYPEFNIEAITADHFEKVEFKSEVVEYCIGAVMETMYPNPVSIDNFTQILGGDDYAKSLVERLLLPANTTIDAGDIIGVLNGSGLAEELEVQSRTKPITTFNMSYEIMKRKFKHIFNQNNDTLGYKVAQELEKFNVHVQNYSNTMQDVKGAMNYTRRYQIHLSMEANGKKIQDIFDKVGIEITTLGEIDEELRNDNRFNNVFEAIDALIAKGATLNQIPPILPKNVAANHSILGIIQEFVRLETNDGAFDGLNEAEVLSALKEYSDQEYRELVLMNRKMMDACNLSFEDK